MDALSHPLVDRGTHRGREIQTPLGRMHRERHQSFPVRFKNWIRQPRGLSTEDHVITDAKVRIPHGARGPRREAPCARPSTGTLFIRGPVGVLDDTEAGPVVETGASACLLRRIESEWMHQVQATAGRDARPADVAGVVRDLGLMKDDVEHAQTAAPPSSRSRRFRVLARSIIPGMRKRSMI